MKEEKKKKKVSRNSKNILVFFCISIILLLTVNGCKKDFDVQSNNKSASDSDRLKLSKSDFNNLYQNLRKVNDKQSLADFQELKSSNPKFISLGIANKDSKVSSAALKLSTQKFNSRALSMVKPITQAVQTETGDNPTYDDVLDEVVDDEAFKAILSENGEIQVEDIVYKVTPYGTFFARIEFENDLQYLVDVTYSSFDYKLRLYDKQTPIRFDGFPMEGTETKDMIRVMKTVFFIDSFLESNEPPTIVNTDEEIDTYHKQGWHLFPPIPDPAPTAPTENDNIPLERKQINYLAVVPTASLQEDSGPAYQNMLDYEINFSKGAGSILQTIFENSTRYHNFNDNYRTSVLMYNRNYGILKTLGLKVKFQKKGWLWWNKRETEEIRGGWDYIAYKSAISVPKISLPNNDNPPSTGAPYLINPYENPYYASPMWSTTNSIRYNLYGWKLKRGSNELFTIAIPGWFIPFRPEGIDVKSSMFKGAVKAGWNELKKVLVKSAPPSGPSIINNNANNYKFPVYSLDGDGAIRWLSINDMENMPKSFNSTIIRNDVLKDDKIQSFVSPYEVVTYNDDKIDIPLDFSTSSITISTNPSSIAFSAGQIAKSLLTEELITNFEVQGASVFGTVKYNNEWRGIRLKVRMKE